MGEDRSLTGKMHVPWHKKIISSGNQPALHQVRKWAYLSKEDISQGSQGCCLSEESIESQGNGDKMSQKVWGKNRGQGLARRKVELEHLLDAVGKGCMLGG